MRARLKRLIFRFARSPVGQRVVIWMLTRMSFAIPAKRLRETSSLLAFYHPSPSYPTHILIVPKRAIADLAALSEADQDFMVDLFAIVRSLVHDLQLDQYGYRLIANGGSFQDFPHLHFHLIADNTARSTRNQPETGHEQQA